MEDETLARDFKKLLVSNVGTNVTCDTCLTGYQFLLEITEKYGGPFLIEKIEPICNIIWPWLTTALQRDYCDVHIKDECRDLCVGMVRSWGGVVADVIAATLFKPQTQCEKINACPRSNTTYFPIYPKVAVTPAGTPMPGSANSKVLHVTDIHLDSGYSVGAITDCKMPVCCHAKYGPGKPGAGVFGDYSCDAPEILVKAAMEEIKRHKPHHVIFTGDAPAHDLWLQTHETNIASELKVSELVLNASIEAGSKFWPTLGNHAAAPVDEFGGPLKDFWLYGPLGDAWSYFLPPSAIVSFKWGGYYTAPIEPGLHIISLQTNYYDSMNLYLPIADHWDMAGQIMWFSEVLKQIAALKEKVFIIAHEKPGSMREGIWPTEITRLISQYSHIITGLFFGHNHNDMFHIVTATADSPTVKAGEPAGVIYVPSSLTPVERSTNPSYRVYSINSTTKMVDDFAQYRFDLPRANSDGFVTWYQAYTPKKLFGLPDLSPKSWRDFGLRMATNASLHKVFANEYHGGIDKPDPEVIDQSPKVASCYVLSSLQGEFDACMKRAGEQVASGYVYHS